jgi:hypothetical protein
MSDQVCCLRSCQLVMSTARSPAPTLVTLQPWGSAGSSCGSSGSKYGEIPAKCRNGSNVYAIAAGRTAQRAMVERMFEVSVAETRKAKDGVLTQEQPFLDVITYLLWYLTLVRDLVKPDRHRMTFNRPSGRDLCRNHTELDHLVQKQMHYQALRPKGWWSLFPCLDLHYLKLVKLELSCRHCVQPD